MDAARVSMAPGSGAAAPGAPSVRLSFWNRYSAGDFLLSGVLLLCVVLLMLLVRRNRRLRQLLDDLRAEMQVRRQAEQALRRSRAKYKRLVEDIGPLTILYSHRLDGTLTYVSPAIREVMALDPDDVIGRPFQGIADWLPESLEHAMAHLGTILAGQVSHNNFEFHFRHPDGTVRTLHVISHVVRDDRGAANHIEGTATDITERKAYQRRLEQLVHLDALTGLPNRELLMDRLKQAIVHATRYRKQVAVAYLDLDGFKAVNDRYGHEAGDQLLVALAQRLHQAVRESDTVARLGGDEFVVLLNDWGCVNGDQAINRLLEAASRTVAFQGELMRVSASIGIALYPGKGPADADHLLREADQAMYRAKQAGKNRRYFAKTA